ncbi:glycosyltransferase family 2 protein [soil metagenome]
MRDGVSRTRRQEGLAPEAAEAAAGFPPLTIRHNPMLGRHALTLCCIMRDERFFLDAFLAHYRALGVDRFIVLDDGSSDGSTECLAAEPDVMLVASPLRYAQQIEYDAALRAQVLETRAVRLWRDQLMNQFCAGQWAIAADADEFLCLPEGLDARALAGRLEREGHDALWGAMIDMYPERIADMQPGPQPGGNPGGNPGGEARFALDAPWYFDGREHIRPAAGRAVPRGVYPGSRARLVAEHGVLPQGSLVRRLRRRLSGYRYAPHGMLYKVPLVFWREGDMFRNCHCLTKPVTPDYVLPIMHFKFTVDLQRKVDFAVASGGYSLGSSGYKRIRDLLERMKAQDAAFLCPISVRYRDYADFARAGIARMPPEPQGRTA